MADTKSDTKKLQTQEELERVLDIPSSINHKFMGMNLAEYPTAQELSSWLAPNMDPVINEKSVKFVWQTDRQNTYATISAIEDKKLFHYKITEPSGDSTSSTWQVVSEGREEIDGVSYDKEEKQLEIIGKYHLYTISPDGQIGTAWKSED